MASVFLSFDCTLYLSWKLDSKRFQLHAHHSYVLNPGRKDSSLSFGVSLHQRLVTQTQRLGLGWFPSPSWLPGLQYPLPTSNLLPDTIIVPSLCIFCPCVPPVGPRLYICTNWAMSDCITLFEDCNPKVSLTPLYPSTKGKCPGSAMDTVTRVVPQDSLEELQHSLF